MRIAVLHPSSVDRASARMDTAADPSGWVPEHEWRHVVIEKATTFRQIRALVGSVDVVVNLCDGAADEDTPGVDVVRALDRLGMAYTGANEHFYDPSRVAMKIACHAAGVVFPAYAVVRDAREAERVASELKFPMIVKHPQGYASVGLTEASRVTTIEALRQQLTITVGAQGSALVEEFIEGREFTVLVAEGLGRWDPPRTWRPVEFRLGSSSAFKHFDMKWRTYAEMEALPVADGALDARLRDDAARCFAALGGVGYGRCDFRVDADGVPHLLEINPNCGIFYPEGEYGSADFILAFDGGHRAFIEHILAVALRHRADGERPASVAYSRRTGFGMVATRDILPGETIDPREGAAEHLVSRRHVEGRWGGLRREWFQRYAWPLTRGIYATWSPDPDAWRPINHACDPNAWLDGLDVVARRAIPRGEPITLDYATFCGPEMAPFACACGARECRQTITGLDGAQADLRARYAGHFIGGD